jgi:predicted PhzF superfamily epimerase YddE/YHI9
MVTEFSDLQVLSVFCAPDGRQGNPLGVFRDGTRFPGPDVRQRAARQLGFSETIFVDDARRGIVDIYTLSLRLPFAGHPLVGAAWLLDADELEVPAGKVLARRDGELSWISARPDWVSARTLRQHASAPEIGALSVPEPGEWIYAWAWQDEPAGLIRARAFPGRGDGIDENEATGTAAIALTHQLGRALVITQGEGSQLLTEPRADGTIDLGGRVRLRD